MNPKKYKSVAVNTATWTIATNLANTLVPNTTLSRSKIFQIAIARLNTNKDIWGVEDEIAEEPIMENEVSIETLNKKEIKHASNN